MSSLFYHKQLCSDYLFTQVHVHVRKYYVSLEKRLEEKLLCLTFLWGILPNSLPESINKPVFQECIRNPVNLNQIYYKIVAICQTLSENGFSL